MSPFQPTVVRGFSKYTRMTISSASPMRVAQRPQALRVLERGLRVVDRARPDHDGEAVVLAVQDAVQRAARVRDVVGHRLRARQLAQELGRRRQRRETANA